MRRLRGQLWGSLGRDLDERAPSPTCSRGGRLRVSPRLRLVDLVDRELVAEGPARPNFGYERVPGQRTIRKSNVQDRYL